MLLHSTQTLKLLKIALNSTFLVTWVLRQDPAGSPAENIIVSDDFAASGTKSGFIGPGQGPQDALLYLGNETTGDYTLRWNMYVPSGNEGYFNVQGTIPASGPITGICKGNADKP